ncbi:MAG: A24 family peptidase [Sphaerobacter sp.]|nr:A24 family peptidase [Sphaerobacter sp.]
MATDVGTIAATVLVGGGVGAVAGALVHAVAERLPADREPLGTPICTGCGAPLGVGALVPFRRRACRACGAPPSWAKLATEVSGAAIVVAALLLQGMTYRGVTAALFSLLLLVILRIDWRHHLIYTATIVPGLVVAALAAAIHSPQMLLSAGVAAVGAGIFFALLFGLAVLIYRQHALGLGDILLAVLIGAMTGVGRVAPALFLGMLLAAGGGLLLLALGRRGRRDYIPYGAYLCAGTILVLLFR